ncbi:MAG: RlmE family RNA methyltransferase [Coxiellaceae bacterium]|nr:RlmE family RNA methyltransferase [Coxiellaceae bacterium]
MAKSNKNWIKRHVSDPYVKRSQEDGYPSRAAYKLTELDDKYHFIKPGMTVIDLGAAPGGWSKVSKERVGEKGRVVALDLLAMDPSVGVEFLQGDFNDNEVLEQLLQLIDSQRVDLVISDMAPNLSGNKGIDQPRAMNLVELAFDLAQQVLKPGGTFLFKMFHGDGLEAFVKQLKLHFKLVKYCKPNASRAKSSEIFVLATDFIGYNQ